MDIEYKHTLSFCLLQCAVIWVRDAFATPEYKFSFSSCWYAY